MGNFWDGPSGEGWQSLAARLEERTRYFWAIDTVSSAINSAMTTEDLLTIALERTVEVTGASGGAIFLPNEDDTWVLHASYNLPERLREEVGMVPSDNASLRQILHAQQPVAFSEQLADSPDRVTEAGKHAGIQSWCASAIKAMDEDCCVMALYSRSLNAFGQQHLELLRVISQLLGLAMTQTLVRRESVAKVDTELRHRVAELEAVIGSLSDGLIICDSRGIITRINVAATRILQAEPGELIGRSVLEPEWNRPAEEGQTEYGDGDGPLIRAVLKGEECVECPILMTINGEKHVISVSASLVKGQALRDDGAVVVLRDITEARNTDRLKEEFLSILSHELRAPLTVISGYAQVLHRRLQKQGLTAEIDYTNLIREHVVRMSAMVGDIVESNRLESGVQSMQQELVNVPEFVESIVRRVRAEQAHSKTPHEVLFSSESGLPEVMLDQRRIDQVLTNLLSNATRYSPDGGEISVRVERDGSRSPGADSVVVAVTDQGIGVAPEEREHLFERAYRGAKGREVSAQGLGLGLYICKLAVEAHGGRIGVEDGPGGVGSTFWFSLPIASPAGKSYTQDSMDTIM